MSYASIFFLTTIVLAAAKSVPQADEFAHSPASAQHGSVIESGRWKESVAAATVKESSKPAPAATFGSAIPEDKYTRFGAAFAEAKVPDCLREDGLKRQPPRIGFFVFQGVLAFPFVALAKVRGKCL